MTFYAASPQKTASGTKFSLARYSANEDAVELEVSVRNRVLTGYKVTRACGNAFDFSKAKAEVSTPQSAQELRGLYGISAPIRIGERKSEAEVEAVRFALAYSSIAQSGNGVMSMQGVSLFDSLDSNERAQCEAAEWRIKLGSFSAKTTRKSDGTPADVHRARRRPLHPASS